MKATLAVGGALVATAILAAWLLTRRRFSRRPALALMLALSASAPLIWLTSLVVTLPDTFVRLERPWLSPLFPAALGFVALRVRRAYYQSGDDAVEMGYGLSPGALNALLPDEPVEL